MRSIFLLTFVIAAMARDFGTSITKLSYAITLTLAMRPVGAFIFGLLGDRFRAAHSAHGRRYFLFGHGIAHGLFSRITHGC
jgi:MFS family permease